MGLLPLIPFLVFLAIRSFNLLKNYSKARQFGLPIILLPVSFEDVWWIPLRPLFSWVERLPWGLGSWYLYTEMGWSTVDGNRTFLRLGENFVLCSPSSNQVITCYPPAIDVVFKDHKNWPQPEAQAQLFALYGQNVLSTNGAEWQRHRRITASAFNENCVRQAWKETVRRATDLDLVVGTDQTISEVRSTFDILTMNVLAAVGLGQDPTLTAIPPGHRETLMDCLGFILKHVTLTVIFSTLKAPNFLLPSVLRRLKVSVAEFRLYMEQYVWHQMRLSAKNPTQTRASTLLEAMVNANEAEKKQVNKPSRQRSYLTESELYGNLYVFNIAGYETTAATTTFALSYLAANPEVQNWLIEEVDAYYTHSSDHDYSSIYPNLVRCLAWMYETLRLASPGPLIVRWPTAPQELPIITSKGESSVTINPGTLVGTHFYGAHLSPRWGQDAPAFNPKRFVSTSAAGEEYLAIPEGAPHMPWGFGPRVCPGKKFSQVEFVAVVAHILSLYRVEIMRFDGETEADAIARMNGVMSEKYFNVSAQLRRPGDAGFRFVRRSTA